jgi:chorismate mutase
VLAKKKYNKPMANIKYDLTTIAAFLEGLEDSIIYKLLDRAQFGRNSKAYATGGSGFANFPEASTFAVRLRLQEEMDARFGRYYLPEERPFTRDLPIPERHIPLRDEFPLANPQLINQSEPILATYLSLLDQICLNVDDGHYGSSVEHDVYALQAIARRIHYGAFYVSEAKFQQNPTLFMALIRAGDDAGIMAALTRPEVEERITLRLGQKVDAIQNMINPAVRRAIDSRVIVDFYRLTIIPLTKAGELAYFKHRLMGE